MRKSTAKAVGFLAIIATLVVGMIFPFIVPPLGLSIESFLAFMVICALILGLGGAAMMSIHMFRLGAALFTATACVLSFTLGVGLGGGLLLGETDVLTYTLEMSNILIGGIIASGCLNHRCIENAE